MWQDFCRLNHPLQELSEAVTPNACVSYIFSALRRRFLTVNKDADVSGLASHQRQISCKKMGLSRERKDVIGMKFPVQAGKLCALKLTISYNTTCDDCGAANGVIDTASMAWISSIFASMHAPEKSRHRM